MGILEGLKDEGVIKLDRITVFRDGNRKQTGTLILTFQSQTLSKYIRVGYYRVAGKAGSCLPLVGSLQYRSLMNCMYWFPEAQSSKLLKMTKLHLTMENVIPITVSPHTA